MVMLLIENAANSIELALIRAAENGVFVNFSRRSIAFNINFICQNLICY